MTYQHVHSGLKWKRLDDFRGMVVLQLVGRFPYGQFAPGGLKYPRRIRIWKSELETRYVSIENAPQKVKLSRSKKLSPSMSWLNVMKEIRKMESLGLKEAYQRTLDIQGGCGRADDTFAIVELRGTLRENRDFCNFMRSQGLEVQSV